jgi:hypothetical protein
MAEPTVQQPVGRRLGVLVRAVPHLLRRARADVGSPEPQASGPVEPRVLSVHLDLVVTDADDAADALDRVHGALRRGDRVYLVGQPEAADPRADDRPFTIWA